LSDEQLVFEDALDPVIQGFLETVVSTGVVWALQDDEGFALSERDSGEGMVMPFWSDPAVATAAATGEWAEYRAVGIELDEWLEHWLSGLDGDGLLVGVDWTADLEGVDMPALELQADLERVIVTRHPD
jgi:hypothetical protein